MNFNQVYDGLKTGELCVCVCQRQDPAALWICDSGHICGITPSTTHGHHTITPKATHKLSEDVFVAVSFQEKGQRIAGALE